MNRGCSLSTANVGTISSVGSGQLTVVTRPSTPSVTGAMRGTTTRVSTVSTWAMASLAVASIGTGLPRR